MDFPVTTARFRSAYLFPAAGLTLGLLNSSASNWLAGAAGLLLVAGLSSLYTGLEISADRRHRRDYWGLLGRRFGRWQPLPPVIGITLKYYATVTKAGQPNVTSRNTWKPARRRSEELVLMLSLHNQPTGLIVGRYDLDEVNEAIDFAHELAEYFDVPVNQYLPPHLFQPLPPVAGAIGPG